MASRDSRSMLVTLELRERLNELSLASRQESQHKENEEMRSTKGKIASLKMTVLTKEKMKLVAKTPFDYK